MKEKRNCNGGMPYPMYPQPMMPMMQMGMTTPYQTGYTQGYSANSISSNTIEQQLNNLEQQINQLEQRVNRLENINNVNSNKYNNSNYYMV